MPNVISEDLQADRLNNNLLHSVDTEFNLKVYKHVNICQYYSRSQFNKLFVTHLLFMVHN